MRCWLAVCLSVLLLSAVWRHDGAAGVSPAQLVVAGGQPERKLACLVIRPGEEFALEFINSIYLAPVRETMVYKPGEGIVLVKVESPSAGVFEYYGLPTDGSGKVLISRTIGEIRLRSADYENHRLVVGDRSLRLKGLISDGEPLIIRVEPGEACTP